MVTLPSIVDAYIQSVNDHDAVSFLPLFAEDALVDDAGRQFRGLTAIKAWSDREIFDANVTFEILDAADRNGETVVTTKVDGNFDRTGLPDPVIIDHHIRVENDKIVGLMCRLHQNDAA